MSESSPVASPVLDQTRAAALGSHTRWLAEPCDPLDHLGPGGFAWFSDGAGFATAGVAARVAVGTGPDRLVTAGRQVADLLASMEVVDEVTRPGTGPIAVGAPGFSGAEGRGEAELVVPELVVGRGADGRCWVTRVTPVAGGEVRLAPGPVGAPPGPDLAPVPDIEADERASFLGRVRAALDLIAAGEVTKVVVARRDVVEGDELFVVGEVLDRLRRQQPDCYVYASGAFVGASPELLVSRRGRDVTARPMAGTVPRTGERGDDEAGAAWLAGSPKERAEHRAVVDAVRDGLARTCDEVSVSGPELARFPSVAHLVSTVRARVGPGGPGALELAGRLHPTPAVAGLPVGAALAAIAELEPFARDRYAGPVGWVDGQGDGEWAVAIRCARLQGSRALLTAGAGIVAGSSPESEWAETEAKLAPMRIALLG